jgi:hypothetical protein
MVYERPYGKRWQMIWMYLDIFETGPEGPELEDEQVEKKSKAADVFGYFWMDLIKMYSSRSIWVI